MSQEVPSPIRLVTHEEMHSLLDKIHDGSVLLLDVRQMHEYVEGHIRCAILLPLNHLDRALPSLERDKPVVIYCRSGVRSAAAARKLAAAGFPTVLDMKDGIRKWPYLLETGLPGNTGN